MKYIILGKNERKGEVGNDSSQLEVYFELGWEVVGSRFDFIKMIKEQDMSNHIAVTSEDRTFFYSKIFENTISYDEFKKIQLNEEDEVDDWTLNKQFGKPNQFRFLDGNSFTAEDGRYCRYDEDYEEIFNGYDLSKSTIEKSEKYVVMNLRARDHASHKNYDNDYYSRFVNKIKKNVTENIYIVGYGAQKFCEENQCNYVDKLVDFVSLIKDKKRCVAFISQSTGTGVLSLTSCEVPIFWIDDGGHGEFTGKNAVLGGTCIHFYSDFLTVYLERTEKVSDEIISAIK